MTTQISVSVFESIDAEHRELDLQYEAIDTLLAGTTIDAAVLCRHATDLAAVLKSHFEREEQDGYFDEIIEQAPRTSREVAALEAEHTELLDRLTQLAGRLSKAVDSAADCTRLSREFRDFLSDCRGHEERENALIQDAWLTDIGTGD